MQLDHGEQREDEQDHRDDREPGDERCPSGSNASQPVRPSGSVNARPTAENSDSICAFSSPFTEAAYQGRPSAAMTPIAAAIAKRMLLRKPIVRMMCVVIGTRAPVFEPVATPSRAGAEDLALL